MTEPAIPMRDDDGLRDEPPGPEPRVGRTVFSMVSSFEEADADDDACWHSRTPAERLAHLELLRRTNDGDAATGRLQRVLELAWLPRSQVSADRRVCGELASNRRHRRLIALDPDNARRMVDVLRELGFDTPDLSTRLFLEERRIVRMGNVPLRIEILTQIEGVAFDECYADRVETTIDGVDVTVIALGDLRQNKRASGRHKDLEDLKRLPRVGGT